MIHYKKLFLGFCTLLITMSTINSQNLLDYENSRKFADYLFQTRQFELAATEFERVIFLEPDDTLAKLKLVRSYRYLTDNEYALARFKTLVRDDFVNMSKDFSDEYVQILISLGQYDNSLGFLKDSRLLGKSTKAEYQLGVFMLQHKWHEAREFAEYHADLLDKSSKFNDLNTLSKDGINIRYKNAFLAASFSAVVPGSGKLYTGRWKDAIFSFLFVTSASWLSYRSISNDGLKTSGIVFGSVALGFHAANIYGSAKSARMFNDNINLSMDKRVGEILTRGPE